MEETLILSDIGVNTSTKICDNLREDLKKQIDKSEHAIKMLLKKQMEDILNKNSAYNDLEDDEKKSVANRWSKWSWKNNIYW